MAISPVPDRRAVWFVWSRHMLARYAFWLQVVGIDVGDRERSWGDSLYLIYLLFFLAGWAMAMLALFANGAARLLQFVAPASPQRTAFVLLAVGLGAWFVYELLRAVRRSPFVFTPEDQLLLCQAPVSRRAVALAWLASRWVEVVLPGILVVLVLEAGVVGLETGRTLDAKDLGRYLAAALRGVSVVLPWQVGALALAWAAGALRLWRDRAHRAWRWVVLNLALLLALGMAVSLQANRAGEAAQAIVWPLVFPLRAAFVQAGWLPGVLVALGLAVLGPVALLLASGGLNLSRAAQETSRMAFQQQAQRGGAVALAREMAREDRLGSGRRSTIWPAGRGVWAVVWKDLVQATRGVTLDAIQPWLLTLSFSLGAAWTPEWGARVALAALWVLTVGQQAITRLRADLSRWWIWRQLPLGWAHLLAASLARPAIVATLVTWLGLVAGGLMAGRGLLPAMWLVPTTVAGVASAAAFATLRQVEHQTLLAGQVPEASELAFGLGLVSMAAPWGVSGWIAQQGWPAWIQVIAALVASVACAAGLWRAAVRQRRG